MALLFYYESGRQSYLGELRYITLCIDWFPCDSQPNLEYVYLVTDQWLQVEEGTELMR